MNAVLKEINDTEPGSITGDDILYGFDGNDSFEFNVNSTLDHQKIFIDGGNGEDTIYFSL